MLRAVVRSENSGREASRNLVCTICQTDFNRVTQNRCWKLGQQSAICLKKNFVKPHKISTQSENGNNNCLNKLNKLKFCKVSQNSFFKHIFLGIKLKKFQLIQFMQTIFISILSICCQIELKFCEVSRNSFSNRYWKFQLSIVKNKIWSKSLKF